MSLMLYDPVDIVDACYPARKILYFGRDENIDEDGEDYDDRKKPQVHSYSPGKATVSTSWKGKVGSWGC